MGNDSGFRVGTAGGPWTVAGPKMSSELDLENGTVYSGRCRAKAWLQRSGSGVRPNLIAAVTSWFDTARHTQEPKLKQIHYRSPPAFTGLSSSNWNPHPPGPSSPYWKHNSQASTGPTEVWNCQALTGLGEGIGECIGEGHLGRGLGEGLVETLGEGSWGRVSWKVLGRVSGIGGDHGGGHSPRRTHLPRLSVYGARGTRLWCQRTGGTALVHR